MRDPFRFHEGYDPEPPDRPHPSEYIDDDCAPDDREPDDNIPDAIADRLSWDAEVITAIEDTLDREAYSRDWIEEAYWASYTDE